MTPSLGGKRIVLTRSASAGADWETYLRRCGAIVYRFPTIETLPAPLTPKLRHALTHLSDFGWIIFTSAAGPFLAKEFMKLLRLKVPVRRMPPIAVIGEKTAEAVREIGYRVRFTPSRSDGRTFARELAPLRSPILLLRADIASPELPRALRARGARVVDLPVYRTKILRRPDPRFSKLLMSGAVDYLTFASPSAVQGFSARVKGSAVKAARKIPAIALGPRIALTLRHAGFRNVRVAREATIEGLMDAILSG